MFKYLHRNNSQLTQLLFSKRHWYLASLCPFMNIYVYNLQSHSSIFFFQHKSKSSLNELQDFNQVPDAFHCRTNTTNWINQINLSDRGCLSSFKWSHSILHIQPTHTFVSFIYFLSILSNHPIITSSHPLASLSPSQVDAFSYVIITFLRS